MWGEEGGSKGSRGCLRNARSAAACQPTWECTQERATGPLRSTWAVGSHATSQRSTHLQFFSCEQLDSQGEAAPPEAADTQSSTSRLMPRLASYRRSFSLPVWWGAGGPTMHAWARYACLGPAEDTFLKERVWAGSPCSSPHSNNSLAQLAEAHLRRPPTPRPQWSGSSQLCWWPAPPCARRGEAPGTPAAARCRGRERRSRQCAPWMCWVKGPAGCQAQRAAASRGAG